MTYAYECEITSVADMLDACKQLASVFDPKRSEIWYRGHEDARYSLQATVQREYSREGEFNLAMNFRSAAPSRSVQRLDDDDHGGWLSLMQHHGLPTRLLDWTESPLIAAYFAVAYKTAPTPLPSACIWALCPQELVRLQNVHDGGGRKYEGIPTRFDPLVTGLLKEAFIHKEGFTQQEQSALNAVIPWQPNEVDPRMLQQSSCFTIHGRPDPLDGDITIASALARFTIDGTARIRLRDELTALGITRRNVFPDLDNLAKHLTEWLHPLYPKMPLR